MINQKYKKELFSKLEKNLTSLGLNKNILYFHFQKVKTAKELTHLLYHLAWDIATRVKITSDEEYETAKKTIHLLLEERLKLLEAIREKK